MLAGKLVPASRGVMSPRVASAVARPSFSRLIAALTSRSCSAPHSLQTQCSTCSCSRPFGPDKQPHDAAVNAASRSSQPADGDGPDCRPIGQRGQAAAPAFPFRSPSRRLSLPPRPAQPHLAQPHAPASLPPNPTRAPVQRLGQRRVCMATGGLASCSPLKIDYIFKSTEPSIFKIYKTKHFQNLQKST